MYSSNEWEHYIKYDSFEDILEHEQSERNARMLLAIEHDRMDLFEYYLKSGANPRHNEDEALLIAVANDRSGFVEMLLDLGCDPKSRNNDPFFEAVRQNDIQLMKRFAELGCDPRAFNDRALHVKYFDHRQIKTIKFLLDAGCDPTSRNNEMLYTAIKNYDIKMAKYLYSLGCELTFATTQKFSELVEQYLSRSSGSEMMNLIMDFGYILTHNILLPALMKLEYHRSVFNHMVKREQIKFMVLIFNRENHFACLVYRKKDFSSIPIDSVTIPKLYSELSLKTKILVNKSFGKNNLLKKILKPKSLRMQMILIE
jgi:hypothetical protein